MSTANKNTTTPTETGIQVPQDVEDWINSLPVHVPKSIVLQSRQQKWVKPAPTRLDRINEKLRDMDFTLKRIGWAALALASIQTAGSAVYHAGVGINAVGSREVCKLSGCTDDRMAALEDTAERHEQKLNEITEDLIPAIIPPGLRLLAVGILRRYKLDDDLEDPEE